jgi:uncharacterized membrane protein HdeD (DUF308 family)
VVAAGLLSCATIIVFMTGVTETPTEMAWPLLIATAFVLTTVMTGAAAWRMSGRPWLNKGHILSAAAAMVVLVWCVVSVFLP